MTITKKYAPSLLALGLIPEKTALPAQNHHARTNQPCNN